METLRESVGTVERVEGEEGGSGLRPEEPKHLQIPWRRLFLKVAKQEECLAPRAWFPNTIHSSVHILVH